MPQQAGDAHHVANQQDPPDRPIRVAGHAKVGRESVKVAREPVIRLIADGKAM